MTYCKICGKPDCKEHSFLIPKSLNLKEFSGSSPPEIFVGRHNYPNINIGILSPTTYGNTYDLASPEEWHKQGLNIPQIVSLRNKLIYGRTKSHIKKFNNKFVSTMQEVALTHKSVSTEFKLKKPVQINKERDNRAPLITNTAIVEKVRLGENPKIIRKVDQITSDTDAKSSVSILELAKARISSSHIMKILSAGLIGTKTRRKLVPTRWSITAVDSVLSKEKLESIRYYPEISEIQVHTSEYLGNHYEFLLLPDKFSFEVIERSLNSGGIWKDYEGFKGRKDYAESVTGAYYANRLALCEYLEKIKRQCSCLVFREIRPEYTTPLGVGILREASRQAFKNHQQKYATIPDALNSIQNRIKQPITNYTKESKLLNEYKKQARLNKWF
jgi:hypothetical protein